MGVFKEMVTEQFGEWGVSEGNLNSLEQELDLVDMQLAVIDQGCLEMEKELHLLLPYFEAVCGFNKFKINSNTSMTEWGSLSGA